MLLTIPKRAELYERTNCVDFPIGAPDHVSAFPKNDNPNAMTPEQMAF